MDWRFTLAATSVRALGAALLINFSTLGPALAMRSRFGPRALLKAWSNKPLRLANFGNFGHMWELYAMWGWIGLFLHASFLTRAEMSPGDANFYANLASFAVIDIGACALVAGALFGAEFWLLMLLCLI